MERLTFTYVMDLNTGEWDYSYTLPPEKAVVAADYQSRGNFNTWDYDYSRAVYGQSGLTVFCGRFGAMLDRCPLF